MVDRFPQFAALIQNRFHDDQSFREMCSDYADKPGSVAAMAVIDRHQRSSPRYGSTETPAAGPQQRTGVIPLAGKALAQGSDVSTDQVPLARQAAPARAPTTVASEADRYVLTSEPQPWWMPKAEGLPDFKSIPPARQEAQPSPAMTVAASGAATHGVVPARAPALGAYSTDAERAAESRRYRERLGLRF